ncbi:hypothetical protein SAMN04488096_10869 [Mesonia phycicola]|uniref:Uncharacterized protein n=1 Tax=Mesonia phycicola TaxID=579105 RepID=A0A1M6GJE0_9FLAO|nr:hypothetical protein [Mesonia phycicola]SHJ10042.1 hypothetical protein SAMN04488096_10869 [Mesonia phycicola]
MEKINKFICPLHPYVITLLFLFSTTFFFAQQTTNFSNEKSSIYGGAFTPKGELRALVIYVNFTESSLHSKKNEIPHWPIGSKFPIHSGESVVDKNTGKLIWAHQDPSDFQTRKLVNNDIYLNLSEFYYAMSQGKFRFYAEVLKDPVNNKPIEITINPKGLTSYGEIVEEVFHKITEIFPQDYDWSRFDNIQNNPSFTFDSSVSLENPQPDNKIDYVILNFRNDNRWSPHPNGQNKSNWPKAIAGAGLERTIGKNNFGDVKIGGNNGLRIFFFQGDIYGRIELIIHEMAHTLINNPHTVMANKASGDYYYYNYGWGLMDSYRQFMSLANAWERWYAGWIDITHDINEENYVKNKKYILKDYLEFGETMRVKLPNTEDEYIWLENHQSNNPYYKKPNLLVDAHGDSIITKQNGLVGFIEKIASNREQLYPFSRGTNGIKIIYGKGNYDYTFKELKKEAYAWNSEILDVNNEGENAYGGQHEASFFRYDFNENNKIEYTESANGARGNYIDGRNIIEVNGKPVWGYAAPNLPLPNKKLSAFSNPPLTNFQKFDWKKDTMAPVILHSLSIQPNKMDDGNYELVVNYEDGKIEDDFRMTGNIILPAGETITLTKKKVLTINKSKTFNSAKSVNGSFIKNTVLLVESGGTFQFLEKSTIILDENSSLIFKKGSHLIIEKGVKIIVKNGATLKIEEGVSLTIDKSSKISIQDGFIDIPKSARNLIKIRS